MIDCWSLVSRIGQGRFVELNLSHEAPEHVYPDRGGSLGRDNPRTGCDRSACERTWSCHRVYKPDCSRLEVLVNCPRRFAESLARYLRLPWRVLNRHRERLPATIRFDRACSSPGIRGPVVVLSPGRPARGMLGRGGSSRSELVSHCLIAMRLT